MIKIIHGPYLVRQNSITILQQKQSHAMMAPWTICNRVNWPKQLCLCHFSPPLLRCISSANIGFSRYKRNPRGGVCQFAVTNSNDDIVFSANNNDIDIAITNFWNTRSRSSTDKTSSEWLKETTAFYPRRHSTAASEAARMEGKRV